MIEFITASILGGILYDATKNSIGYLADNMKTLVQGYTFNEEEVKVLTSITQEVMLKNNYAKVDFVNAIDNSEPMQQIIKELQDNKVTIQINNINTNNGAVMGDNHGTMNFGKK